jgi:hypothetical protein
VWVTLLSAVGLIRQHAARLRQAEWRASLSVALVNKRGSPQLIAIISNRKTVY